MSTTTKSILPELNLPPINEAEFFKNHQLGHTDEVTSGSCIFTGIEGVVLFMFSDTEKVNYWIDVDVSGSWRCIAKGRIPAADLHICEISFYVPKLRVRLDAQVEPTRVSVHAHGYPAVYKREA